MVIYNEVNNLYDALWSGGLSNYERLTDFVSESQIESFLTEIFCGDDFVDIGKINDFLWFDIKYILECFGIEESVFYGTDEELSDNI